MVNTYKQDEEKTKFSWANFKRMLEFVKPYNKELIMAFFLGVLASILMLIIPKIMAYAIDNTFIEKKFMEVILLSFMVLVLILVSTFLTKIKRDKLSIILDKVSHDMKVAIFEHLQVLPNDYYDTHAHGKIYTRATSYPEEVTAIMCYVFLEIILDIINLIFALIFMFSTSVKLTFISIGLSLGVIILFLALSPIRRKHQQTLNEKNANVNAYISESLNGIRITQSFNREEKNESILNSLEQEKNREQEKMIYLGNLNWSITGAFNDISIVLVYFFSLYFWYPTVSVGTILAIASYTSTFWNPISYLTSSYNDIMDALTYLEKIFELLDEEVPIKDSPHAKKIDIQGKIEFRDVTFSYNESKVVLKDLNLTIHEGEKVGIVGETGSGKSTILNLISRFYDIDSGTIFMDNVDIKDIKLNTLRCSISMMSQDNFIFARSVYDNLVLDKDIPKKEVENICKRLGIHEMIRHLDKGYDTILLDNGSSLSSGERQLLCIARIMLQNPKIIILDEATSNIDLKTERMITKALNILTKNRTTIMVAHRLSTVQNCDNIFLIKDKKVAESGTHEELIRKKGEYFKLYCEQAID